MAQEKRLVRPFVEQYLLDDDRRINILAEGRLINLASAEGHPASVIFSTPCVVGNLKAGDLNI